MRKRLLVCISAMLCIVTAAACSKADKSTSSEQTVSVNEAVMSDTEKEQLTKENNIEETITEEDTKEKTSIEAADTTDNNAAVKPAYSDKEGVELDPSWQYAGNAVITTGNAVYYKSSSERKGITVAVNAGHGTVGGTTVKTFCHPDGSPKTTGGTTASGSTMAVAVSSGMTFNDGVAESRVTLRMAEILRDGLLDNGYDVLMLRDSDDVQLDNVARTVIANNAADCHIALHWDGDNLSYDKGCFYIAVPDGIKDMEPVASHWQEHNALGEALIAGLSNNGAKINGQGSMKIDLTQTSYSTIPSVDIELGNQCSDHNDSRLETLRDGLIEGIRRYFE